MKRCTLALALAAVAASCRAPDSSPPLELLGTTYLVFAPEGEEELTSPVTVGGERRPALVAPMPAEFRYRLEVPERPLLTFAMGLAPAPGASGASARDARVRFTIKGGEELPDAILFEREVDTSSVEGWVGTSAELDRFAGREIWLVFQTVLADSDDSDAAPVVGVFGEPILHDRAHYRTGRGVVLVTVDGLGRDDMSLYGNERRTTPGLEALASEALVFDDYRGESMPILPGEGFFTKALLPRRPHSSAEEMTDRAIEFLHARGDGDFFLRVRYDELVAGRELPARFRTAFGSATASGELRREARVLLVDREIERLVREMKRLGVYDASIVVVTTTPREDGALVGAPLLWKAPWGRRSGARIGDGVTGPELPRLFSGDLFLEAQPDAP